MRFTVHHGIVGHVAQTTHTAKGIQAVQTGYSSHRSTHAVIHVGRHSLHVHVVVEVHASSELMRHRSLLYADISRQQLVLIRNLGKQFLVEANLLQKAYDRLLVLTLKRHAPHIQHFLMLLALDEPL